MDNGRKGGDVFPSLSHPDVPSLFFLPQGILASKDGNASNNVSDDRSLNPSSAGSIARSSEKEEGGLQGKRDVRLCV